MLLLIIKKSLRLKYAHLKNKVSEHIPVYHKKKTNQMSGLLNGNKDDFSYMTGVYPPAPLYAHPPQIILIPAS